MAAGALHAGQGDAAPNRDTAVRGMVILAAERLNADCYPDTVWGRADERFQYLPRYITWGQAPDTAGWSRARRDSVADCLGTVAKASKVRITELRYPAWAGLHGTAAFQSFNRDTVTDIMITLWGRVPAQGNGNGNGNDNGRETPMRDTMRMVVLFGQRGLDTLGVVDLSDVSGVHRLKFTAVEMRRDVEVRNPKVRDISGRLSWEIEPVDVDVEQEKKDTARHQPGIPRRPEPPSLNEGVRPADPNGPPRPWTGEPGWAVGRMRNDE